MREGECERGRRKGVREGGRGGGRKGRREDNWMRGDEWEGSELEHL